MSFVVQKLQQKWFAYTFWIRQRSKASQHCQQRFVDAKDRIVEYRDRRRRSARHGGECESQKGRGERAVHASVEALSSESSVGHSTYSWISSQNTKTAKFAVDTFFYTSSNFKEANGIVCLRRWLRFLFRAALHYNLNPCRGNVKAAVYLALLADKSLLVAQKDMYIPNVSVTDFPASLALIKGI